MKSMTWMLAMASLSAVGRVEALELVEARPADFNAAVVAPVIAPALVSPIGEAVSPDFLAQPVAAAAAEGIGLGRLGLEAGSIGKAMEAGDISAASVELGRVFGEVSAASSDLPQPGGDPVPAPSDKVARLAALNAAVADVLKPYNNDVTSARFTFKDVATNSERAVSVSFDVDYRKTGPGGRFQLNVNDFSYDYPEAEKAEPKSSGRIATEFNLLKVVTQKQFNDFAARADQSVKEFAEAYRRRYGDAAKVSAEITRRDGDAMGNVTALGLSIKVAFDLAKLPSDIDPKDVPLLAGSMQALVTTNGIELSFAATHNSKARQFEVDQTGMKEFLDKLLARDPEILGGIGNFVRQLDQIAASLTQ